MNAIFGRLKDRCPVNLDGIPDDAMPLTCSCSRETIDNVDSGNVYGSDPYPGGAMSNICRAAVHAGAIPRSGGRIVVTPHEGSTLFLGSTRNGITTSTTNPGS